MAESTPSLKLDLQDGVAGRRTITLTIMGQRFFQGTVTATPDGAGEVAGTLTLFANSAADQIRCDMNGRIKGREFELRNSGPVTLGSAYPLSDSSLQVTNETIILTGRWLGRQASFQAQQAGDALAFSARLEAMEIGDVLKITAIEGGGGPELGLRMLLPPPPPPLPDPVIEYGNDLIEHAKEVVADLRKAAEEASDEVRQALEEAFVQLENAAVQTVQHAVSIIVDVFRKLEILLADLLGWLKEVFDWVDIMNTQRVLKQVMSELLALTDDRRRELPDLAARAIDTTAGLAEEHQTQFHKTSQELQEKWAAIGDELAASNAPGHHWLITTFLHNLDRVELPKLTAPPGLGSGLKQGLRELEGLFKAGSVFQDADCVKTRVIPLLETCKSPPFDVPIPQAWNLLNDTRNKLIPLAKKTGALLSEPISLFYSLLASGMEQPVQVPILSSLFETVISRMPISVPDTPLSPTSGLLKGVEGKTLTLLDLYALLGAAQATTVYKSIHDGKTPFSASDTSRLENYPYREQPWFTGALDPNTFWNLPDLPEPQSIADGPSNAAIPAWNPPQWIVDGLAYDPVWNVLAWVAGAAWVTLEIIKTATKPQTNIPARIIYATATFLAWCVELTSPIFFLRSLVVQYSTGKSSIWTFRAGCGVVGVTTLLWVYDFFRNGWSACLIIVDPKVEQTVNLGDEDLSAELPTLKGLLIPYIDTLLELPHVLGTFLVWVAESTYAALRALVDKEILDALLFSTDSLAKLIQNFVDEFPGMVSWLGAWTTVEFVGLCADALAASTLGATPDGETCKTILKGITSKWATLAADVGVCSLSGFRWAAYTVLVAVPSLIAIAQDLLPGPPLEMESPYSGSVVWPFRPA